MYHILTQRAVWTVVWAVHASSMVESTADDHLTVDGDANVCAGAKQKVSAVSLGVKDTGSGLKDTLSSMH